MIDMCMRVYTCMYEIYLGSYSCIYVNVLSSSYLPFFFMFGFRVNSFASNNHTLHELQPTDFFLQIPTRLHEVNVSLQLVCTGVMNKGPIVTRSSERNDLPHLASITMCMHRILNIFSFKGSEKAYFRFL
jgi:hypothetical protein